VIENAIKPINKVILLNLYNEKAYK